MTKNEKIALVRNAADYHHYLYFRYVKRGEIPMPNTAEWAHECKLMDMHTLIIKKFREF